MEPLDGKHSHLSEKQAQVGTMVRGYCFDLARKRNILTGSLHCFHSMSGEVSFTVETFESCRCYTNDSTYWMYCSSALFSSAVPRIIEQAYSFLGGTYGWCIGDSRFRRPPPPGPWTVLRIERVVQSQHSLIYSNKYQVTLLTKPIYEYTIVLEL